VAQASFDPPGLTVAVRKDRGMETLLTPGKRFAMSMLAEGKHKAVQKVGRQGRAVAAGWGGGGGGWGGGVDVALIEGCPRPCAGRPRF
jgi:hypothetical protein